MSEPIGSDSFGEVRSIGAWRAAYVGNSTYEELHKKAYGFSLPGFNVYFQPYAQPEHWTFYENKQPQRPGDVGYFQNWSDTLTNPRYGNNWGWHSEWVVFLGNDRYSAHPFTKPSSTPPRGETAGSILDKLGAARADTVPASGATPPKLGAFRGFYAIPYTMQQIFSARNALLKKR